MTMIGNLTKAMVALGLVGAAALAAVPSTAAAQGFYFNGPGFSVGVGTPYYGYPYYGSYNGPYAYYGGRYYHHPWRYRHHRHWHHW
jgi:hypothetical protein